MNGVRFCMIFLKKKQQKQQLQLISVDCIKTTRVIFVQWKRPEPVPKLPSLFEEVGGKTTSITSNRDELCHLKKSLFDVKHGQKMSHPHPYGVVLMLSKAEHEFTPESFVIRPLQRDNGNATGETPMAGA